MITPNKVLTTAWCFPRYKRVDTLFYFNLPIANHTHFSWDSFLPNVPITAWMNTVSLIPDGDRVVRAVVRVVRAPDYNPATGVSAIKHVLLDLFSVIMSSFFHVLRVFRCTTLPSLRWTHLLLLCPQCDWASECSSIAGTQQVLSVGVTQVCYYVI